MEQAPGDSQRLEAPGILKKEENAKTELQKLWLFLNV